MPHHERRRRRLRKGQSTLHQQTRELRVREAGDLADGVAAVEELLQHPQARDVGIAVEADAAPGAGEREGVVAALPDPQGVRGDAGGVGHRADPIPPDPLALRLVGRRRGLRLGVHGRLLRTRGLPPADRRALRGVSSGGLHDANHRWGSVSATPG